jgi:hypothetical protein
MKTILVFISLWASVISLAQMRPADSLKLYKSEPVPVYTRDYMNQYNRLKRIIVKVYPYALYAADVLDEINQNALSIEKRRKQNKFYKDAYQDLKNDFKYVFYELYTSEGRMLMKLVHRETGMTVYQIAEVYRGKKNAEVFELMGKIWDQDLQVKFDPNGEDKIAEHVIHDIQAGIVPFNDEVVILSKDEYKVEQQKDKERDRQRKKNTREHEKQQRQDKRSDKKDDAGNK